MRLGFKLFNFSAAVLTGLLFTTGCSTDDGVKPLDDSQIEARGLISGIPPNTPLIGLSPTNELVNLLSGPPAVDMGTVAITGLRSDETMLAIDTRPKTKQLFGVSDYNIIYRIDPVTGVATPVSPNGFTPVIDGKMVGFDFNPADDLIRLITDSGQNLRISPITGAVVGVDVNINSFTAAINASAYTPVLSGKATLYDIDIAGGYLYKQFSPNTGILQLVGSTGYEFTGEGGFDITSSNIAFAVQYGHSRVPQPGYGGSLGGNDDTTQDAYRLYTVNLKTGLFSSYGKVRPMIGLAVK
jgi:hypothetical protein